jgi:hypothetical protein
VFSPPATGKNELVLAAAFWGAQITTLRVVIAIVLELRVIACFWLY